MKPPNILLVALDTVRADHVGCYGYARDTTPNLDRLASEGLLLENLYTNHFPTIPSFTTLFTGLDACEHRIVGHAFDRWYELDVPLLAERLQRAGYFTAAVDNLVTLRSGLPGWFARGFLQYLAYRYEPTIPNQAKWITDRALMILDRVKSAPFFLFVHYWDAHNPYWPPPDAPSFEVEPVRAGEPTLIERFTAEGDEIAALTIQSMLMDYVTNYDFVVAQYDRAIWNVDRQIGRLLDGLRQADLDRDTLVIALSDHGEAFGEFGAHCDHHGPADANMRVPVILRWPGTLAAGRRQSGFFDMTDLNATLVRAAGLDPVSDSNGRNLLDSPAPRDHIVSAECTRQANWILRTADFKLVDPAIDPKSGQPYADLNGKPRGGPTLHDMRAGAVETVDVASEHPDERERLTRKLRSYLAERLRGRADPVATQGPMRYLDLLERCRLLDTTDIPSMPWNAVIRR